MDSFKNRMVHNPASLKLNDVAGNDLELLFLQLLPSTCAGLTRHAPPHPASAPNLSPFHSLEKCSTIDPGHQHCPRKLSSCPALWEGLLWSGPIPPTLPSPPRTSPAQQWWDLQGLHDWGHSGRHVRDRSNSPVDVVLTLRSRHWVDRSPSAAQAPAW